ncbi:MAG: hypothetical protein HY348_13365 [Nitrospira defluvii]|nr:hypothetical protein [Nitrospira defluvii]
MPSRIIHEKCRKSLSLNALSAEAERLFWRLTTAADDYGRFDADPRALLGDCFPYKIEIFKSAQVEKWRDELTVPHMPEEPPLIQLYTQKGRTYGHFVKWTDYQRDRSKERQPPKPKFPAPEECTLFTPGAAAPPSEPPQAAPKPTEAPKVAKAPKSDGLTPKFMAFWEAYPARSGRRVGRALCVNLFAALSEEDQDLCISAAKEYARHCAKEERTPRDPERFFRGKQGEVWREFIPAPPVPQRRPMSAVTPPPPPPPVGEKPPPEAMERFRKILPSFSMEGQA